ncbi:kinase-like protein [Rhizoclosmatium globosum]|uniref:Kinase-like protein n=1 Tax=Rhizoclosmatium globosum TaxID=329046 RepID=A0A1Y2CQW1_9FUNG|nr:kinase-like protein [Rhizoclosmatium globosum]|eukprot:ORY49347.1 kinase-like protein [Rhizoclosmatium globosum]
MGNCCSCCFDPPVDFDAPVDISHFELCRSIGKGAFGKVRIIEHKKTKVQYALKYINKQQCAQQGLANNMLRERRLLEECHSPFVCNLRYAFQDDLHLLMVLDLKLGGDLDFHLRKDGFFPEERAKFYFAEIACGLVYLHSLKIVHRDLKPGNVLLDEFGHASLTISILHVTMMKRNQCRRVPGPPEVVNKTSYLNSIDWWSLGIMTYEMLYGYTPYGAAQEVDTKYAIRNSPLVFPESTKAAVSDVAKEILAGLIERDVSIRLGSKESGGSRKIKEHKWFEGWDWEKVEAREVPVPFKPDVEKNMYYNPILELEEALFEDNPLQSRPVKYKEPKEYSKRALAEGTEESDEQIQLRMLTEGFLDFDFTKVTHSQQSVEMNMGGSTADSHERLVPEEPKFTI